MTRLKDLGDRTLTTIQPSYHFNQLHQLLGFLGLGLNWIGLDWLPLTILFLAFARTATNRFKPGVWAARLPPP